MSRYRLSVKSESESCERVVSERERELVRYRRCWMPTELGHDVAWYRAIQHGIALRDPSKELGDTHGR